MRAEVVGVLRNAKAPKSNVSKDERSAINKLSKDKTILVMPADKGRSTVIIGVDDYEKKVQDLLNDDKTYELLPTDPSAKYKRKLIATLARLKQEGKIDESQYRLLYPTTANTPRLYCTTKIHKAGNPVRPIVDYTDSIGYESSRALADLLGPLVGKSEHHVKNSKHLAQDLADITIQDEEMFNSHDVVSLFTNTPIDIAMDIVKQRLQEDTDLKKRTKLKIPDIM